VAVNLESLAAAELVRLALHRDEWFARRARVCLAERGADAQTRALLGRA
jgi:hypothetical protein